MKKRIFCKIFLGETPFWVGLLGCFERVENLVFLCCEFIIKTTTLQIHRWTQKHLEIYNPYIFNKEESRIKRSTLTGETWIHVT